MFLVHIGVGKIILNKIHCKGNWEKHGKEKYNLSFGKGMMIFSGIFPKQEKFFKGVHNVGFRFGCLGLTFH